MSRTFRVRGQLQCQLNAYDRQPCQFNRFTIDIQRDQQTVASAKPLPDGSFGIPLSPGTYTLFLRDYGRQPPTIVRTMSFTLTPAGQHPELNWTVDGSTRPVDIKRFKSK
ncbi:hypothetical protein ACFSUS_28720 [Spirosoma soli]|uniref:Carboxypeptidase regulatory-like domain-containing protein n=1 Tax=Spirosoma soli TaxID=1770529 RepID=A0ABW5MED1_9BACT